LRSGELARVQRHLSRRVQVAEALVLAIGRASASHRSWPLARLELGRRRLEQRFARVTGAAVEA
jgi:transposase